MLVTSKLPQVGTTIFTVMSRLAEQHGALNLGQGFPDFDPPPELQAALARYVSSGHLLFVRDGNVMVAPFDLERLEVSGPATVLIEGVTTNPNTGAVFIAASDAGTVAYLPGDPISAAQGSMMWLDRAGASAPLRSMSAAWALPRFSPDGTRVAMTIADGRQRFANELFIGKRTVHFGGIEERDASLDRIANQRNTGRAIRRLTVAGTERHAAQADGRHLQRAKLPLLHMHPRTDATTRGHADVLAYNVNAPAIAYATARAHRPLSVIGYPPHFVERTFTAVTDSSGDDGLDIPVLPVVPVVPVVPVRPVAPVSLAVMGPSVPVT